MAGFDDPRYLQQVIQKLQTDVEYLKKSTLPLASQQRGPIPGFMRAVQINDVGQKSSMWLNLQGNTLGSAPYQAVTDPNGTIRVELGNLAANGVSAAHFGWRVNDSNAVPIADAIGLSQVMKQLGRGDLPGGPAQTFTTTSFVAVNGCSVTFSLVRQARVLALFEGIAQSATATGQIDGFVDGNNIPNQHPSLDNADSTIWWGATTGIPITGTSFYSDSLAAGSHTVDLRGKVQTTPGTLTLQGCTIIVWLLGT